MYFVCLYPGLAMVIVIVTGNSFSHVQDICIRNGEGKDMELHLNHTARDLSDVILSFNGKAIAEAKNVVSMKWDPGLSEIYTERLSLSNLENLTITLRNLNTMDTGMYNAYITTAEGILKTISRDITVSVAPVVEGHFIKMNEDKDGQDKIFTCGFFSDFGKPPVTFHWNVSESKSHSIILPDKQPLHCSAVGPAVENCDMNLTYVYSEENVLGTTQCPRLTLTLFVVSTVIAVIAVIVAIAVIRRGHKKKSKERAEEKQRREFVSMRVEDSTKGHNIGTEQIDQDHILFSFTESDQ